MCSNTCVCVACVRVFVRVCVVLIFAVFSSCFFFFFVCFFVLFLSFSGCCFCLFVVLFYVLIFYISNSFLNLRVFSSVISVILYFSTTNMADV